MRKKEFLIKGCETKEQALANLFEELLAHLKDKSVWKWRNMPETNQHDTGWAAYARIEFT